MTRHLPGRHDTFPVIMCAACHKQVDRVNWVYDVHKQEWHIEAQCHGDTDNMVLTDSFIMNAGARNLKQGVAFATPRIQELEIRK